jgi:hypothetical protein
MILAYLDFASMITENFKGITLKSRKLKILALAREHLKNGYVGIWGRKEKAGL